MASMGYHRHVAREKPFLNARAMSLRHQYASVHLPDTHNDWRRTIFVDEAAVRMNGSVRTWVTRKKGEAYLLECLAPKLLSARSTVMVWGAIWYGGRSKLVRFDCSESEGNKRGVTAKIYSEQITCGELKSCWTRVNNSWRGYGGARIVEDGATIHTLPVNRSEGERMRFIYLQHPPSSPDLNPIENCWAYLKYKLSQLPRRPTTPNELFLAAEAIWKEIPQQVIDATVDSMIERITEVKKVRGAATRW